ncbi:MAG: nicotinate-nucleotide--dimethylbenzimidazole phosphoribosyltransferase [Desulfobacteraceae bacterium]|nr:nicotinate-nucleotide--dimethylbenzimidazole phosphoribosyltransferase [Desulfobacteraceae bacterium]
MRLVLSGLNRLEMDTETPAPESCGFRRLNVQFCAVCRTDAKMWKEGHRDLTFPRVPGHEFVGTDRSGRRFAVWPGRSCGGCRYCRTGRENLCDDMKITGFHHDGGFSDTALVPPESLIPVPEGVPSTLACFAEPVGCAIHALEALQLREGERLIVYGGGTVGLIAALVGRWQGAVPLVIERNAEKIHRIGPFLEVTGIECRKDTTDSEFDTAVTACPDPIAFNLAVVKLARGGRLSFFSGLKKNQHLESNLVNLMHYKEISLHGAYGLTRSDMRGALVFIEKNRAAMELLVEKIVRPDKASAVLADVLSGRPMKYILDFTPGYRAAQFPTIMEMENMNTNEQPNQNVPDTSSDPSFKETIDRIRPVNAALEPAAQYKIDNKTKPLGALGKLESVAVRMSLIQDRLDPALHRKALFVFAGDHGIAEEGVSAYPAEVTGQMVTNFLNGGAAINVLCRHHDIDLQVVDMGVNADFDDHPGLVKMKVRKGTRNFAIQDAMTPSETLTAVKNGMRVFSDEHEKSPIHIVGMGEMGIGNTTSASAVICAVTGISAREAAGRGTGVDDKGLEHKIEVIEKVLAFHTLDPSDGLEILQKIGGFEVAGIVGAVLTAASVGTAVVLDGLISTAAGLLAYQIRPDIGGYLFSGHKSVEIAQKAALDHMGLEPLIDFNMRLGEGTGAALAMDVVDAACRIMREMASFDEAGVSNKA